VGMTEYWINQDEWWDIRKDLFGGGSLDDLPFLDAVKIVDHRIEQEYGLKMQFGDGTSKVEPDTLKNTYLYLVTDEKKFTMFLLKWGAK
jgi:hypothetical protein